MTFLEFVFKGKTLAAYKWRGKLYVGSSHPQILEDMLERHLFPGIQDWDELQTRWPTEEDAIRGGLLPGFYSKGNFRPRHDDSSEELGINSPHQLRILNLQR